MDPKTSATTVVGLAVLTVGIISDGALQIALLVGAVVILLAAVISHTRRGTGDSPADG